MSDEDRLKDEQKPLEDEQLDQVSGGGGGHQTPTGGGTPPRPPLK